MSTIEIPATIEKKFLDVVKYSYDGDIQKAISTFLKLHEKYGWKEQLWDDVKTVRAEVRKKGGIKAGEIDDAIKRYRNDLANHDG